MRKKAFFLLSACVLAGCSVNGQKAGEHPEVFTEDKKMHDAMRAEAEYQMTGKVTDKRLSYIDPNARIKLKPTPGMETTTGPGVEVLTSMKSGGYFAFVQEMPITQYFSVVRRADCDEFGTYIPLSTDRMKANPTKILSGQDRWNKPQYACFPAFDDYFARGHERLKDADGAVFDLDSAKIDEKAIYWIPQDNKIKMHFDGWAIKFGEPSHEQVISRLRIIPSYKSNIEQKQFSTVIYWIEKNKATQYVDQMLSLLPTKNPSRSPKYWEAQDLRILHALAKIAPNTIPSDFWFGVIEKGVRPGISHRSPFPGQAGNAPMIAANVLACQKADRKVLISRFSAVLSGPYPTEHKRASAAALYTLGATDVVEKIRPTLDPTVLLSYYKGSSEFKCPYARPNDAI